MATARRHAARAIFAVLVPLAAARAQQGSAPPALDDAWLRAVVERVQPAVEQACGRKFQKPPLVGLADAGDVMRALRDDLAPANAAFHAGQPQARIQKSLQMRADLLSNSLLGKYGFASKEVYVLPHLVRMNLGLVGHGEAAVEDVLQLVVAHELVHALQDQELDLARRVRECVDSDAADALSMGIEGHAVFCSERAAEALGLQAAIAPLRSVFAGNKDLASIPKTDLAMRRLRGAGIVQYLRIADFFAREYAAGGNDRLWQVLAEPAPRTRRLLLEPPHTAGPACRNLMAAFAGIDDQLAGRNWTIGRGSLSERLLLVENLPRGQDLVGLLPSLRGSAEWFAVSPTPASWRSLYALSFVDDAAAQRFVALAEDVATGDMQQSPLVFVAEPGPAWQGGTSRRLSQAPKAAIPPAARVQLLWLCHGRHVLQATFCNAPLDDKVLVDVARAVLARLDA